MPPEIDLLAIQRGSITAPAGCGKTQLIADALKSHSGNRPILVLTHTNAGVTALRTRLKRAGVSGSAYRLSTIDGFAMRLIAKFPARSGHHPELLELRNASSDYPAIREAARQLLVSGHVAQPIAATYARLLVDEYQDCSTVQHAIVSALAALLPTCVLGDPLQAIFGFGGNRLVHWEQDVQSSFPAAGSLGSPWRWQIAGNEELGQWLLAQRPTLTAGLPIDLTTAPPSVRWVPLVAGSEVQQRLTAARASAPGSQGTVLVIGESMNVRGRHQLSSQTPGAMTVERVDMPDLISFARRFNPQAPNALQDLVTFAADMMTGVGAPSLVTRVATIRAGRARNPPTPVEAEAVAFDSERTMACALRLVNSLVNQADTRVYRPEILHCCRSAMQSVINGEQELLGAALQARERNRHLSRPIARRAVGSTLLLKGLEADVAVILHPEKMSAQDLYVALTRGAKGLVICSYTSTLTPAR
ncbi:UvrD-helicase domain-containing protein [Xanthomonas arboricola]|uniref:UvrD-helicase domain-containing protein n=1 Tax=Xanthomonas arboricola TaxID=56448 RepID=UPI002B2E97A3|nr:UvrD-helicase domain-containing protein [Xanthomonas arboricola]